MATHFIAIFPSWSENMPAWARFPQWGEWDPHTGRYYHGGSSSYMTFENAEDIDLVLYLGKAETEEDEDALVDTAQQLLSDAFPPLEGCAEDLATCFNGWISPDGRIFPCFSESHKFLASRLQKKEGIPDTQDRRDTWLSSLAEDSLLASGWVKVSLIYWFRNPEHLVTARQSRVAERMREIGDCPTFRRAASDFLKDRL